MRSPKPGCRHVRAATSGAVPSLVVPASASTGPSAVAVGADIPVVPANPTGHEGAATGMVRAKSAPASPRPPGRPGRPALLARPASWPGCDPYRPRRRDQAQRMHPAAGGLTALLHRVIARTAAALVHLGAALVHLGAALGAVAVLPQTASCERCP